MTASELTLSRNEAIAIYELLSQLSGGSPENVFAWDGTDSLDDVTTASAAKIFKAAGKEIPKSMETQQ